MSAARRPSARALVTVAVSAPLSRAGSRAARHLPRTVREPWERVNHAGRAVTLLEGPVWVLGSVVGHAAGEVLRADTGSRAAAPVVTLSAGALGALDDLVGSTTSKGLGGHLGALAHGEVTTGAIKIVGLAVTGSVGAALVDSARSIEQPSGRRATTTTLSRMPLGSLPPPHPVARVLGTLLGGAVIAGAANAVNLFDLRPGRALKVAMAVGGVIAMSSGSSSAAAAVGASLGVLGDDLAARSMLGDTGANAAGALLGLAVVEHTGPLGRALVLAGLAALTLASERISFSTVIADSPILRRIDEWGREG